MDQCVTNVYSLCVFLCVVFVHVDTDGISVVTHGSTQFGSLTGGIGAVEEKLKKERTKTC